MSLEIEFGKYIKSLRKEQNLTIRQLEDKSGVSNAYLSQIENGKRGLPSPDIIKKIHEPLGVGYDELMEKAGYISPDLRAELIPETIKTMESVEALNELISNAAEIFISSVTSDNGLLKSDYKNFIVQEAKTNYPECNDGELNELLKNPAVLSKWFDYLTLDEKISFLNMLIKDFVDRDLDPSEIFQNYSAANSNKVPVMTVPVLGSIAAGQPILAEEHIEEWTEIPNMWNLKFGEAIVLKVKGDSMIGSRIYDGDKVVVKLQQEVENGEIAVVNVNGNEATLKRVKKTENGQVILYPDNPRYEPTFVSHENARIIGKVIQVMFEPTKL
ncbi:helix-turn-helix domain-containing protein [Bacillus sp. T33-2]|uniref:helix-turn-helix domain-containing protein n=1 Tax=Bacillus sp. T33-2 TaxID=2054168 RepID=UPI0015E07E52|nr:S24 family peptidase [Bacillus sp. T33-2]